MACSVQYSPAAIRDLRRVQEEVLEASRSSKLASRYVDELMDKVEARAEFPRLGKPLYYEDGFMGYYSVTYKAYTAFYRIEGDDMLVDRILFARSDYMRRLGFAAGSV